MASGGTSQDTGRIRPSEGRSHSGDGIKRETLGYGKNPTERGHSHPGDGIGRDKSGHGKHPIERGTLTSWRRHRERQVRTYKESDQARGTHFLETASGATSQDTERIQPSEGYSLPGDGIGRDKSGQGKNPTERGALTLWRQHQEGQVRTRKESDRARGTHILEIGSGGRDKSEHGKNPTERGALTS